jgi:hypothetical protein
MEVLRNQAKEKLKGRNVIYSDIIALPMLFDAVVELAPLKSYFTTTPIFQPFAMKKEIGFHAGVSKFNFIK